VKAVNCEKQMSMLKKIQEMQFVAVELNLYLDTHPCDVEAINDFNCAVKMLEKRKQAYQDEFGPLFNFGFGGYSEEPWQWVESPWPWEI
jgi:spore coat protein JB